MKRPKKQQILCNRQNIVALTVLILSLLVYWWLRTKSEVDLLHPEELRETIQDLGWQGIIVYISLIALAVVMSPIPGALLTVAAGAVWGTFFAGIYSVIGGFLGGLIAYFIGRILRRTAVYTMTGKVIYFTKNRGEIYLG